MALEAVRTPEDRFENLPDFPFAPNFVDDLPEYDGLRVHYLDEGPKDATRVFLCLHGQPSWSYLYRKMLPVFTASGGRVIAPDWLGFGKSDKPVGDEVYGFHFHRNMMLALIERLDLNNITLVCQDWGGILGLTLPHEMPERFKRLIVMNTGMPTGHSLGDGFLAWRDFCRTQPDLDVGGLMKRASPILSEDEAAAYAAPFPSKDYKAGVRRFPEMVMISPGMTGIEESVAARKFWSEDWTGQSFMAVGMQDPVLGPTIMSELQTVIKDCPDPMEVADGGHFVQEWGGPIAEAALKAFGDID